MTSAWKPAAERLAFKARFFLGVLAIVSTTYMTPPALAQVQASPPIGTRIPRNADEFPIDDSRPILAGFGQCVVRAKPGLAHEFILSSNEYMVKDRFRSLANADCLGQALSGTTFLGARLQMSPAAFRYTIADALARRNLQSFDANLIRNPATLPDFHVDLTKYTKANGSPSRAELAEIEDQKVRDANDLVLFKFGECAVRANPPSAKKLLGTKINSPEELMALKELNSTFSGCLDRNQKFTANRMILRGTVAFNYYRLAYAQLSLSSAQARRR